MFIFVNLLNILTFSVSFFNLIKLFDYLLYDIYILNFSIFILPVYANFYSLIPFERLQLLHNPKQTANRR